LGVLARLEPEDPRRFYDLIGWVNGYQQDSPSAKWIDGIKRADQAAKVVIRQFLRHAIKECADDATRVLLENSSGEADDEDLQALRALLFELDGKSATGNDPADYIKKRIAELDRFTSFCGAVRSELLQELSRLPVQPATAGQRGNKKK
jgi:hypothetical protein